MGTPLFNLLQRKQVGRDNQYAGYPNSYALCDLRKSPWGRQGKKGSTGF